MILTTKQLRGLDSRNAELLGKPSLGAHYEREDYTSHKLDEGAQCVVCGRPATDAHHVVHRKTARGWTMNTPLGKFVLLSPLFALCRECHDGFHGGARFKIEWEWKSEAYMDEWWQGHTLAHVCNQGSNFLLQEGEYLLTDKKTGEVRKLGGR